jgi:glycosyltransferase involved in cell wall biosynthesis
MLRDYEMKVVPLHLRQCSVVVATSERIKDELLGIEPGADPECILVKPNGINVDAFPFRRRRPPSADAPFRVVSVCRVEPKKGLLYLVEAVARLRDQGRDVVLHLVGGVDDSDGSREYHRDLCARISRLGLDDRVRLEGRRSEADINALFGEAHLFAAPYVETASGDKDGIPTSLLEAMSSGLPVVATDAGSIGEVITDGRDGVLVPQRDAAALADAIAALMRDPDRCAALGAHATQRVREAFDAGSCDRHFHARLDVLARGPAAARHGVVAPAAVHPRPGPGGRS